MTIMMLQSYNDASSNGHTPPGTSPSMFANGLPFELLSWIFSICWDDHSVPPERVALVNKYWRHVAINSSQLWTDVYYDEEADIPRMSLCLKRSGNLPVNLVMNVTRTEIEDFACITTLCSIISPHFHRVRTFRLSHRNHHVTDVGDERLSSSLTAFLERMYCPSFRSFNYSPSGDWPSFRLASCNVPSSGGLSRRTLIFSRTHSRRPRKPFLPFPLSTSEWRMFISTL